MEQETNVTEVNEQVETVDSTQETEVKQEKTFTQKELDSIIEKRLAKEKKKMSEQIEKERTEAERLANLSAEERKQEELRMQQEAYESQLKEFEDMKKQFEKEQLLSETTKQLNGFQLPIEMARYLVGADAETTKSNIDNFQKLWTKALQDAVDSRLKSSSTSPTVPLVDDESFKNPKDMTYEEFMKYTQSQQR